MNVWGKILSLFGWKVKVNVSLEDKCVICVAPHTSNYDFIIGLLAYKSLGRKANFIMKSFWFFFPMNLILKSLGGIPVDRSKNNSLIEKIISIFNKSDYLNLAITPEGTRENNPQWHKGFLYIAYGAKVPIVLAVIDYSSKTVFLEKEFNPTGNPDQDMKAIRLFYDNWAHAAKYPQKFSKLNK